MRETGSVPVRSRGCIAASSRQCAPGAAGRRDRCLRRSRPRPARRSARRPDCLITALSRFGSDRGVPVRRSAWAAARVFRCKPVQIDAFDSPAILRTDADALPGGSVRSRSMPSVGTDASDANSPRVNSATSISRTTPERAGQAGDRLLSFRPFDPRVTNGRAARTRRVATRAWWIASTSPLRADGSVRVNTERRCRIKSSDGWESLMDGHWTRLL